MFRTIKKKAEFEGIGLHTGRPYKITLIPNNNNEILFLINGKFIPASYKFAKHQPYATLIEKEEIKILTPEHLLSAVFGLGIDSLIIKIDSRFPTDVYEVPIMDGSAYPFVFFILNDCGGVLGKPNKFLKIKKDFTFESGDKRILVKPNDKLKIDYEIYFSHPLIKKQQYCFNFSVRNYIEEIARARTFGFLKEIKKLRNMGLGLGGDLNNALVFDDKDLLNSEGLRYPNEPVRHKILDLLGDLSLSGYFFIGEIKANKTSHSFNLEFVKSLLEKREVYEIIEFNNQEVLELARDFVFAG